MDASARNELASIKRELNSIISELESISSGVRNDFTGIGNDKCADCINKVLNQYYYVRRQRIPLPGSNGYSGIVLVK